MDQPWRPKFAVGDEVCLVAYGLLGRVVEVDNVQRGYVVEIKQNPKFRLLCTERELKRVEFL
jgi:hypothetical protein